MSNFETVIYQKSQDIAYITLNRPRVLNAVNIQMRDELYQILTAVRDDPEVMIGIVNGAGERAFSAGADLTEFSSAPSRVAARNARWQRDLWGLFLSINKPLIVAIHGFALAAGCEMAMCCDIRIASQDARFSLPEVGIGMIPAAGGSQTLPRTVPRGKATQLLLSGEIIDAAEALRIGLVNRVVPRDKLIPTAQEIAQKIMSRGPIAVRYAKEAIYRGLDMSLEEGLELETKLAGFVLRTEDAREGIRASLEKRPPKFKNQ